MDQYFIQAATQALREARGNMTKAASSLAMSRATFVDRVNRTPVLVALKRDLREEVVDVAEDNIFEAVYQGDQSASRYILNTIGKDRGYSTRNEVYSPEVSDVKNDMEVLKDFTDEELFEFIAVVKERANAKRGAS